MEIIDYCAPYLRAYLDEKLHIYRDEGSLSTDIIHMFEKLYNIRLPILYKTLTYYYNGARLENDCFDYADLNLNGEVNTDAIAFDCLDKIDHRIENIKSGEEVDWPIEYRFEDGLIPFGDNGGGDMICFDYRNDKTTDDPPIVIWNHDMGLKHRVVFIANNFEEFINMLHEPED